MTSPSIYNIEVVLKKIENGEKLQTIIDILKKDPEGKPTYQLIVDWLLYKGRLVFLKKNFFLDYVVVKYLS